MLLGVGANANESNIGSTTISANISGAGDSLTITPGFVSTITGLSQLFLSGTNTYSGSTTISTPFTGTAGIDIRGNSSGVARRSTTRAVIWFSATADPFLPPRS